MPENTDLAITTHRRMRMSHRLVYCEVLVIGTHDLHQSAVFMIKADIVLEDIQQPRLFKDTTEERLVVGNLVRLHLTVHALPFHVAVLLGSDGTSL